MNILNFLSFSGEIFIFCSGAEAVSISTVLPVSVNNIKGQLL